MKLTNTKYTTTIMRTSTLSVDLAEYPEHVVEKIIAYGVQRIYNDAIGSAERFPTLEEKVAHVEKMIADHKEGIVGRAASAGVDDVTREARKLARAALKKAMAAQGKAAEYKAWGEKSAQERNKTLDTIVEKNPTLREHATKEVERRRKETAALAAMDIDIDA